MVYNWKYPQPVPAQVAGEYLDSLKEQNGGTLTPQVVLDNSRDTNAVLHPCFEWDDGKAAERFRLYQARQIITSLVVTIDTPDKEPKTVNALVNIAPLYEKANYIPITVAMNNVTNREQVLKNALIELRAFQNKYSIYSELAEVCKAIDNFAGIIDKEKAKGKKYEKNDFETADTD